MSYDEFTKKVEKLLIFLAPKGIWFGFTLALSAYFEQCLNNNSSPMWSSVFGFPFLHHGYYAFILCAISLLIFEWYSDKKNRKS